MIEDIQSSTTVFICCLSSVQVTARPPQQGYRDGPCYAPEVTPPLEE